MATTLAAGDDPAIIAAEDDPAIRAVLEETLGAVEGWSVTTVADGAKLLEALATLRPSLILLDVNMPGLDGLEVYRLLRERDGMADVPVLFVTARPDALKKAKLAGPYDQLAKPFDIDALEAKVSAMLGEAAPEP